MSQNTNNSQILIRKLPASIISNLPEDEDFTSYEIYKQGMGSYVWVNALMRDLERKGLIIKTQRFQKGKTRDRHIKRTEFKIDKRIKPYQISLKGIKIKQSLKQLLEDFK